MPLQKSYEELVSLCEKDLSHAFAEVERYRKSILPGHKKFSKRVLLLGVLVGVLEIAISFTPYDPAGVYTHVIVATLLFLGNLIKAIVYSLNIPRYLKQYAEVISKPVLRFFFPDARVNPVFTPSHDDILQSELFVFNRSGFICEGMNAVELTMNSVSLNAGFVSVTAHQGRSGKRNKFTHHGLLGIIRLPQIVQTHIAFQSITSTDDLKLAIVKICEGLKAERAEKMVEPVVMLHQLPVSVENPVSISVNQNKLYLFIRSYSFMTPANHEVNQDIPVTVLYERFYQHAQWLSLYIETARRLA